MELKLVLKGRVSMSFNIRRLRPNEIECRAQIVKEKGCSLLLYKDARCDMKILDETFGSTGWQRKHRVVNGNLFCDVEIWDNEKEQWITKEDVGVESRSEAEKGQASDSFKRACFNVGIGRELYTAPFIWVNLNSNETYKKKNKYRLKSKVDFYVDYIDYNDDGEIKDLIIKDQNGKERYKMGSRNNNGSNARTNSKTNKDNIDWANKVKDKYMNNHTDENKNTVLDFLDNHKVDRISDLSNSEAKQLFNKLEVDSKN